MRENSSPAGLQLVMLGVIPKYILNATCQGTHNSTMGKSNGGCAPGKMMGLVKESYVAREQNCGLCKTLGL